MNSPATRKVTELCPFPECLFTLKISVQILLLIGFILWSLGRQKPTFLASIYNPLFCAFHLCYYLIIYVISIRLWTPWEQRLLSGSAESYICSTYYLAHSRSSTINAGVAIRWAYSCLWMLFMYVFTCSWFLYSFLSHLYSVFIILLCTLPMGS